MHGYAMPVQQRETVQSYSCLTMRLVTGGTWRLICRIITKERRCQPTVPFSTSQRTASVCGRRPSRGRWLKFDRSCNSKLKHKGMLHFCKLERKTWMLSQRPTVWNHLGKLPPTFQRWFKCWQSMITSNFLTVLCVCFWFTYVFFEYTLSLLKPLFVLIERSYVTYSSLYSLLKSLCSLTKLTKSHNDFFCLSRNPMSHLNCICPTTFLNCPFWTIKPVLAISNLFQSNHVPQNRKVAQWKLTA